MGNVHLFHSLFLIVVVFFFVVFVFELLEVDGFFSLL